VRRVALERQVVEVVGELDQRTVASVLGGSALEYAGGFRTALSTAPESAKRVRGAARLLWTKSGVAPFADLAIAFA
jgi:hypothetical protein